MKLILCLSGNKSSTLPCTLVFVVVNWLSTPNAHSENSIMSFLRVGSEDIN